LGLADSHRKCDAEQRQGSNDKQYFSTTEHSDLLDFPIERLLLLNLRAVFFLTGADERICFVRRSQ
jgi:hypothetical protein